MNIRGEEGQTEATAQQRWISSLTDVLYVDLHAESDRMYPIFFTKKGFSEMNSGDIHTSVTAEAAKNMTWVDGILWINSDGTPYLDTAGLNGVSLSTQSTVVDAFPAPSGAPSWGYALLLTDGTCRFDNGHGDSAVLDTRVVLLGGPDLLLLKANNEVSAVNYIEITIEKIGTVSDWHNVAYLKGVNDTVVAAMKNGTVEVVSAGSASKPLLDFLASIKDLKVTA